MNSGEIDQPPAHPAALTPAERGWEQTKHVIGKAIKYAVVGAIIGAVLFAFVPGLFLGTGASIVSLFSTSAASSMMGMVASAAVTGATWFGAAAAIAGAAMGLTTMGQAADEREEDRIAQYDNLAHRQQRNILLAQQRDRQYAAMARQMGALGINPNAALGAGNRGAGQGLG